MKEGWKIKALNACIENVKIGTKLPSSSYKESGLYPIISQEKEFISGYWNDEKDLYIHTTPVTIFGDHTMVVKYVDFNFVIGADGVKILVPKPFLDPKYFFYWVSSIKINNHGYARHYRYLKEQFISYPSSLAEQQRIVEILDAEFAKIDALRANATKSLQAAKDLFQSALKQELQPKEGWKSYKLQDVCTEYGTYGMSLPSKSYDGIRYLRITDITEWGELNNEKVSADTKNIDDKYLLHDGDILFARTGATVGKTLVYNNTMGKCSYAGYLIRYRPNQEIILPQVLYYITHSKFYYNWVMTTQKSTTLPNISAKLYNKYEFSIPISLAEQTRIVSRLDQLNERCKTLQENYDRTITLCEDLKQALLRKAFNGEL